MINNTTSEKLLFNSEASLIVTVGLPFRLITEKSKTTLTFF